MNLMGIESGDSVPKLCHAQGYESAAPPAARSGGMTASTKTDALHVVSIAVREPAA
jgi:hypothetical protein